MGASPQASSSAKGAAKPFKLRQAKPIRKNPHSPRGALGVSPLTKTWYGATKWVVYVKLRLKSDTKKKFQLYKARIGTAPSEVGNKLFSNDNDVISFLAPINRKDTDKTHQSTSIWGKLKLKQLKLNLGQKSWDEVISEGTVYRSNTGHYWETAQGTPWTDKTTKQNIVLFAVDLNYPFNYPEIEEGRLRMYLYRDGKLSTHAKSNIVINPEVLLPEEEKRPGLLHHKYMWAKPKAKPKDPKKRVWKATKPNNQIKPPNSDPFGNKPKKKPYHNCRLQKLKKGERCTYRKRRDDGQKVTIERCKSENKNCLLASASKNLHPAVKEEDWMKIWEELEED